MEPHIRVLAGRILTQQVRNHTDLMKGAHALVEAANEGAVAYQDREHINKHREKKNLAGLGW